MSRIWGRSVKYALWAISREACVIINNSVKTKATLRMVFHDAVKLVNDGLIENDCELTNKGQQLVPTALSPSAHAQAMRFFLPGVAYVFDDQHCVRKDRLPGKASRYVAEMMLDKGTLNQTNGIIRLADVSPRSSWKLALWTLSQEPCHVTGGVLRAKSDNRVVFSDAHALELNGYVDANLNITELGRRMIPKMLSPVTVRNAMSVFSEHHGWQFSGNFAVAVTGGRLSRYTVERLVEMGKLQIYTGGVIVVSTDRFPVQLTVTAAELKAIRKCTTSTVTLIKRPETV